MNSSQHLQPCHKTPATSTQQLRVRYLNNTARVTSHGSRSEAPSTCSLVQLPNSSFGGNTIARCTVYIPICCCPTRGPRSESNAWRPEIGPTTKGEEIYLQSSISLSKQNSQKQRGWGGHYWRRGVRVVLVRQVCWTAQSDTSWSGKVTINALEYSKASLVWH